MKTLVKKTAEKISNHKQTIIFAGVLVLVASVRCADAVTAPVAGSFAFDVFDIGVNKILGGPIGFVAGVGAMALGAVSAIQQKVFAAVPAILGGAVMLNADSLVTSLGLIV